MAEIEDQIQAWADAAAPVGKGDAVVLDEVSPAITGSAPHSGRRWLVVAAAVVLVVGGAVVTWSVADRDRSEPVRTDSPTTTEPPVTESTVGSAAVAFEVLHVGLAGDEPMHTIRTAGTDEQLASLWDELIQLEEPTGEAEPVGPPPDVDFDDRAVVSFTIPDDDCPQWLERFEVGGRLLTPIFVEPMDGCGDALVPKRYVVAIDWASVDGDVMELLLPADETFDLDAGFLQVRRGRTEPVVVDLELANTTLAAGEQGLPGTVIVTNTTGKPIEIGFCGAEFAVGLENDEVDQQLGFNGCLETAKIPPGTSTYGVTVGASYGSCTSMSDPPGGLVACLPGGGVPPLPAGEYRTRLYLPSGLEGLTGPQDPLTLNVTAG